VDDDAEIVLWNGGIWPWLDAPTAIRAVVSLAERRPRLRLVFMGATATSGPARRAADEAHAVAAGSPHVVFNDGWVPYDERASWLLDADCALSTHRDHLETRFAFRTRVLDCFWSGLPVVATGGDDLGDRIAREGLGAAVSAGDVAAVAAALEQVLDRGRDAYEPALAAARADYRWSQVVAPLVRWLGAPAPPRPRGRVTLGGGARDAGFRAALSVLGRWPRL
jgi:glycosyltransferase involved in cell wall biosynthesis